MLKIATILASLLLSSTALAGADPAPPAPYPDGVPPQKSDASSPGVPTNRLGNQPDSKTSKDAQSTDATKKEAGDIDQDSSDDIN